MFYKNYERRPHPRPGELNMTRKEVLKLFEKPISKEIKKDLGTIRTNNKGWSLKVRVISWNGGADKLDIREWDEDGSKCGKGISLTVEEARSLYHILHQTIGGGVRYET